MSSKLENERLNKLFYGDCVEWFKNEMLEMETYMKEYIKKYIEINPDTKQESYGENKCWLGEKQFEKDVDVAKAFNSIPDKDFAETVVEDHCHLTGRFRVLTHNDCNLNTRKGHSSFVPILFQKPSGDDSHLIFKKFVDMAIEKDFRRKRGDIVAK